MKWIVFFISFLVLSLSSLPCCLLEDIGENTLCIETHSETGDDPTGDEPCSPFFNCGSCTGFAIQENIDFYCLNSESSVTIFTSYPQLFKSIYHDRNFKPPRGQII